MARLSWPRAPYATKPISRDQLIDVLQKLETKLSQRVHRILIVEDDPVQREAVAKLRSSQDVEAVTASTAAECLDLLKSETIDCMTRSHAAGCFGLFAA